jgi:hypothetical protein
MWGQPQTHIVRPHTLNGVFEGVGSQQKHHHGRRRDGIRGEGARGASPACEHLAHPGCWGRLSQAHGAL